MAEHVHKTYSCDRCKADLGDKRPQRIQTTEVVAAFHWRDGPGPQFKWADLCDRCDSEVKAFFGVRP